MSFDEYFPGDPLSTIEGLKIVKMMDFQKISELKRALAEPIEWYKKNKKRENSGEIDSSYIYDECIGVFEQCSRADLLTVLEILGDEE